jgi:hypothetical protein
VLANETTFVEIQTESRFGYLSLTIDDVPSNVDSGYARISGSGMADIFAPLYIDSLARDTAVEYDGRAFALIEYIPIGQNRSLQVFLLKDNGQVAYQGCLTITIQPDSNRIGRIVLDPASAKLRVSVVEPDFDTASVVGSVLAGGKPETGRLIISEIMYNSYGTDNNEWIELYNASPDSVDLSLFRLIVLRDTLALSGGLAPGGFFVIGESDSSYIDLKTGALNIPNSGDSAFLIVDDISSPDPVSDRVFIRYTASENWPASTDGASIELNPSYLDALSNNYGIFWSRATRPIPGTALDKGTPGY